MAVAADDVFVDLVTIAMLTGGPAAAMPLVERARLDAEAPSAPTRAVVDCAWGFVRVVAGDASGAVTAERGARGVAALGATVRTSSIAWAAAAAALLEHHGGARLGFELAERSQVLGDPVVHALVVCAAADHLARIGRLRLALERVEGVRELAAGRNLALQYIDSQRASLLLESGHAAAAADLARATSADGLAQLRLGHVLLRLDLAAGRHAEAAAIAGELARLSDRLGVGEPCLVPWARDGVAAHIAAGQLGAAAELAAWLAGTAEGLPCRWPVAAALAAQAALAAARGEDDEARSRLRAACAAIAASGLPVEQARLLVDLGAVERRLGRTAEARQALGHGLRLADEAGAGLTAALAREELGRAGGGRRSLRAVASRIGGRRRS